MSGIELLERLKLVDPHIEIIMLTAYETVDTVRRALRLGACDYLNKPFDIVTIRAPWPTPWSAARSPTKSVSTPKN